MERYEANGKSYIAISKGFKKSEALTIANGYFKAKKDTLRVQEGHLRGDSLEVGVKGDVWVISRR